MTDAPYVAYIGIDWADRKHDIALYDSTTDIWEESIIKTRPQDILAWVNGLRARYGNQPIAVAMEQKRGPLLYALCQYENLVLFPVNPRTVANYRKAFQPSRAKSDPVDARLLVDLLRKHPEKLERWVAECPEHRALRLRRLPQKNSASFFAPIKLAAKVPLSDVSSKSNRQGHP